MESTSPNSPRMHLRLDPWADCLAIVEREKARHPHFADVRDRMGCLLLEHGRARDARTEFETALSINPRFSRAHFHRLVALRVEEGRLDETAWAELDVDNQVEGPDRLLWSAWYHAQKDDLSGAVALLDLLAEEPQYAGVAHFHRAIYLRRHGDAAQVREALTQCALVHPVYRSILEARGWIASAKGRRQALTDPMTVLASPPDHVWNPTSGSVYAELGNLSAGQGALEQATQFFEDAFLREGRESAHQVRMAQVALATGDEERAVALLRRAIEVDPTSMEARVALGFEYQSQGYHDDAIIQFEVAARLQPSYPDVQYNLGLLYQAKGRQEDALRCLQRALEINARYFQARTSLAQILLHAGRFEEALDTLAPIDPAQLRSADLLVQKAEAHLALGQIPIAVRELDRAAELNPEYPRTFYVLGQAHRKQGLKRKAHEAWKQYLERTQRWKEEQPFLEGEEWMP